MAPKLSQNRFGVSLRGKLSSWKRESNQTVSDAAFVSALYLASIDDRATALYFFELQDMGYDPRKLM